MRPRLYGAPFITGHIVTPSLACVAKLCGNFTHEGIVLIPTLRGSHHDFPRYFLLRRDVGIVIARVCYLF